MLLEWDAGKNLANQKKHSGIAFEVASRVFADPHLVISQDRVVDHEQRWHGLGLVGSGVLLVVHVYRKGNSHGEEIIRIISARAASPHERRIYLEQASY